VKSEQARPEDAYSRAAHGWATGAAQVYQPLADTLVATTPHSFDGRLVLDACAGTGCGGLALEATGARVVATDLSEGMLLHDRASRPPSAVADVCQLAIGSDSVDDVILPFVLNHLPEPVRALAEAARVSRTEGAVLANVFSNNSTSPARDRIDEVASSQGFVPPGWYVQLKDTYAADIGTRETLRAAAVDAGLTSVIVEEAEIETGLTDAAALVDYRLSMAHYAVWLSSLTGDQREQLWQQATEATAPLLTSYRPIVLMLSAISR
jgi:ubiquinone/menaquinone biosynthesis C-methylase UbiE